MPKFRYTAVDLNNQTVKGELDAADVNDLYTLLRAKSLTLTGSTILSDSYTPYIMKATEISEFSRQMAEMLSSGLTVIRALGILRERDTKPKVRIVYDQLYKYIYDGFTLSEALRRMNHTFPELFINMCESGESSGQLENTMRRMGIHYEKEHRLRKKVKSAMTYPMIILIITLVAVALLFIVILPMFLELFQDMDLPLPTRICMAISYAMTHYWYIFLIVLVGLPFLVRFLLRQPRIRLAWDRSKFSMPLIRKPLRIIYTARFARALNSLYSSGLPLIDSLTISSKLTGNKYLESLFPPIISDIRNGDSLSNAIRKIPQFDPKLATTIYIGEESGRLGPMLENTADSFDYEAEVATDSLVAKLEPVMIILMAVIVGMVMLSVFMPIFELYNNVEQLS